MTPRQKAEKLLSKFGDIEHLGVYGEYNGSWNWSSSLWNEQTKEAALIAVDEIFEALDEHYWQNRNVTEYYRQVKQEIEKL
jgi:hypothetical protein